MKGYRLAIRLPGETEWIHGARAHSTMRSVHDQIRRVAPEWRKVFGDELETEIATVEEETSE